MEIFGGKDYTKQSSEIGLISNRQNMVPIESGDYFVHHLSQLKMKQVYLSVSLMFKYKHNTLIFAFL